MKKTFIIFIAITLFIIFMCVAYSSMTEKETETQIARWDEILKGAGE